MKYLFIFCGIALLIDSCREEVIGHDRIFFKNNSNIRLYVEGDYGNFPDTSIVFGDLTKTGGTQIVLPDSKNESALEIRSTYEERLSHPSQDTLMVFVFDANVLETTPWESVKTNYLILKRYDLSLQDLKNAYWTIMYP